MLDNVTSGSAIAIPTIPVQDGYTFEGWYKDENCTQIWDLTTDVVIADIKLFAKWLLI